VVVHTCNPALRRLRQDGVEFKVSLGCEQDPVFKKEIERKEERKNC
jgi:hypothetical protein